MMTKLLCVLFLAAAAHALPFRFPASWDNPLLKIRVESPAFNLQPGESGFVFPDTLKESRLLLDSFHTTASLKIRRDNRTAVVLDRAVPHMLEIDLVGSYATVDLSGLSLRRFSADLKGGDACFSMNTVSAVRPDIAQLCVRHGNLRFDHFGAMNAQSFRADLRGGKAVIDFRGMKADMEGALSVRGGSAVLVFPRDADVTVTRGMSAMSRVSGTGFESKDGVITRPGKGPSCRVRLQAWGGSVILLSADDDVSLDEALEDAHGADLISGTYLDDLDDYLRYNRVEGLYLGAVFDSRRFQKKELGVTCKLGYAISQKLVEYEVAATFNRRFERMGLDIKLAHGKKVDSDDDRRISVGENTLQMFLFGNDYKDYFLSTCTDLSGNLKVGRFLTLSGKAGADEYKPLDKKANWYLFGSDSLAIRGNHWTRPGDDHFLQASLDFDNAGDLFPRRGLDAYLKGEYSGGAIKSDFTYRKAVADARGYCRVSEKAELSFRGFAGEVVGKNGRVSIPDQKMFDFGGLSSVRGFPFFADWTLMDKNRMFFISSEFKYAGRVSRGAAFPPVSGMMNKALFIFFFDAGRAWNTEDNGKSNTGFTNILPEIKPDKFHKTFGLGLADRNEHFRIDFMRLLRGDRQGDARIEDRVNIRFARAF